METGRPPKMTLRRLLAADRPAVVARLQRHPESNMFMLSRLEEGGEDGELVADAHLLGAVEGDALLGVAHLRPGGRVVLAEMEADAGRSLARLLEGVSGGWRILVAPEEDAAPFLSEMTRMQSPMEMDRTKVFYLLRGLPPPGEIRPSVGVPAAGTIRPARESDLPDLVEMAFGLAEEDLGLPREPGAEGPMRERLSARISTGEFFVAEHGGRVSFKVMVGTRSARYGAQIEGIYTRPEARRQGMAFRALTELCGRLLSECPFVCLHVGAANTSARALYEKIGFRPVCDFRLARRAPYDPPSPASA